MDEDQRLVAGCVIDIVVFLGIAACSMAVGCIVHPGVGWGLFGIAMVMTGLVMFSNMRKREKQDK